MENTEGKGEIAHYEQFLLLPQCLHTTCTADKGLFGKGLTPFANRLELNESKFLLSGILNVGNVRVNLATVSGINLIAYTLKVQVFPDKTVNVRTT